MAKRIYVRPENDCPRPLVSNWPNQDAPNEYDYTLDNTIELRQPVYAVRHEFRVFKGDRRIGPVFREKGEAEAYAELFKKERPKPWVHCFEPTQQEAYELRQKEKAEWRWNSGHGA
jgi:hypothetical protein